MAGLEGKVAFITGAARGQGRNHAVRLAERGVDIIALDINRSIDTVPYAGPTPEDLAETVRQVEALDRRIIATEADVRDRDAVKKVVDEGVAELGRLDIVLPNAGIASVSSARDMDFQKWDDMIDINLNGPWNAISASLPYLKSGACIVATGSVASLKAVPNLTHYVAAKHGVMGIVKTMAIELGPENIRVNAVLPTNVGTDMVQNEFIMKLFMPDLEVPTIADAEAEGSAYREANVIPIPWIEVDDVTNAILFLVSDEARYITGVGLPVDAGFTIK
jgi:(+)-trans-carveol dehydrogenase